jgi:hypothetical protein
VQDLETGTKRVLDIQLTENIRSIKISTLGNNSCLQVPILYAVDNIKWDWVTYLYAKSIESTPSIFKYKMF